jgi:hypothetical protein
MGSMDFPLRVGLTKNWEIRYQLAIASRRWR